MIPQSYITAWRKNVPWKEDYHVEQDLIIYRAIIDLFTDDFNKYQLVFCGGTALHKLFLFPSARYSECIYLARLKSEPISPIIECIREKISFLDKPRVIQKEHSNTISYCTLF